MLHGNLGERCKLTLSNGDKTLHYVCSSTQVSEFSQYKNTGLSESAF